MYLFTDNNMMAEDAMAIDNYHTYLCYRCKY